MTFTAMMRLSACGRKVRFRWSYWRANGTLHPLVEGIRLEQAAALASGVLWARR
jgi:hypothetical protein